MRFNCGIGLLAVVTAGWTPGCSGGDGAAPTIFTFDLSQYDPGRAPPSLAIANQTLVFPLDVQQPPLRSLSVSAPGDLRAVYTRVGCWVDPEAWIGGSGAAPVTLPATPPARLDEVTVEHDIDPSVTASPAALAQGTCVSVRSAAGLWQPFVLASQVVVTADAVRLTFALRAAAADAVAIFLPTYTYIARVSYRAEAGP
jgi:hypothetical protein